MINKKTRTRPKHTKKKCRSIADFGYWWSVYDLIVNRMEPDNRFLKLPFIKGSEYRIGFRIRSDSLAGYTHASNLNKTCVAVWWCYLVGVLHCVIRWHPKYVAKGCRFMFMVVVMVILVHQQYCSSGLDITVPTEITALTRL